jgi:hypothetical protein
VGTHQTQSVCLYVVVSENSDSTEIQKIVIMAPASIIDYNFVVAGLNI